MLAGALRHEIALRLKSAYSEGLLSAETFAWRIDQLGTRLVDPGRLVGDLSARRPLGAVLRRVPGLADVVRRRRRSGDAPELVSPLLALDWSGAECELTIGRHYACDIVLGNQTVSRHHACLIYRDGVWLLHDLQSTNGTLVNGVTVEHCVLHPGDEVVLGEERLTID